MASAPFLATGTSGFNNGVWGRSFSPAGVAVRGENMAKTGSATGGAFFSSSPRGLGLFGSASAASGSGVGVRGFAQIPNGVGVRGDVASGVIQVLVLFSSSMSRVTLSGHSGEWPDFFK